MFQDLRYGIRLLLKHRAFTLVAVLSLALGIGANTALFSVVDAVLLKSLPVDEPDRLVLFEWQSGKNFRTNGQRGTFAPTPPGTRGASVFRYDTFQKLQQEQAQSSSPLSDLFGFAPLYEVSAVTKDSAEPVRAQAVTGGYFAGVRVKPLLGRAITPADDQANATPVVVLSYGYWTERFASNPEVVGEQMKLNDVAFTIIGVTPPEFRGTMQVGSDPKVTVPLVHERTILGERTGMGKADRPPIWFLHIMGRLKPGATYDQARESLGAVFQAHALEVMPAPRRDNETAQIDAKEYPRLTAQSGGRGLLEMRRIYSWTIYGLLIVVVAVLLIACANVANLLLARAALRGPEIGIRLAVGAGRWRLIRQLLTESLLLAVLGGCAGIVFAFWGKSAIVALTDRDSSFLPPDVDLSLNWRVLALTLGVSLFTGVLFGLIPAWRATRLDLNNSLKQSRRNTGAVSRLSKGLVIAQVAISLLLLLGAGLFIRTLLNLQAVNVGFKQENLLLFAMQPGQAGYKGERLLPFYEQLFSRLDAMPGVKSATFGRIPLIAHYGWNTDVLLPGEDAKSAGTHMTDRQMIRENYFTTLEIPVLSGRGFSEHDTANSPRVAIVNQTFGKQFFPDGDLLGKRVRERDGKREYEIIGVVADTKYDSQRDELGPLLYTPWRQEADAIGEMYFSIRTIGEPTALVPSVRQVVRDLDGNLAVTEVGTQTERSQRSLGQERLYARLLTFFGFLALVLAGIGLSGVLAYSVAQRTNEIGVRMALGAQVQNVLRLIIWQGMKLVIIGLTVGGALAYGIKRLLASQYYDRRAWQRQMADLVFGVKGFDPATLIPVAAVLLLVALIACYLPARRAASVDPLAALRQD
jgi:predicted permease